MSEPENIVLRLLRHFDSQSQLATFCLVTRAAVTQWKQNNEIPRWHVDALHRYTNIPKWEICPKSFKKEESNAANNEFAGQNT